MEPHDLGVAVPRQRTPGWVKIGLIVLLLLMFGQLTNFIQNSNIREEQEAAQMRGYLNRAVTCDLAKAIGSDEPKGCEDPSIRPYRDTDLVTGSTAGARSSARTAQLVCFILKESARRNPGGAITIPPDFCPGT